MKKLLMILLALVIGFSACKKDSDPDPIDDSFLAPLTVQKKNVVLEEVTGVRCPNCPDGHVKAKALSDAYPGKVVIIAIHASSYADPQPGWANFTTPFGSAIMTQSKLNGVPGGTINRHQFPGANGVAPYFIQNGGTCLSRGGWAAAAAEIMKDNAPVNIGAKSTYNATTKTLTVKVDLYYTEAETDINMINVALLQNGLIANQSGGSATYEHVHMLRHLITGPWGELIPAESKVKGSKYSKTFTYVVPNDYNGAIIPPGGGSVDISKCEIAVFVARDKVEILNGIKVKAN